MSYTFYEFFAGGGMARIGLGQAWTCLFANDFDLRKVASYKRYFDEAPELVHRDIAKVSLTDLPSSPDLTWASFPCQDLSLAGAGAGLEGGRSGTFWPFWNLMRGLHRQRRAPKIIALENVIGMLTSRGGKDFAAIADAFAELGYKFGAVVIDAVKFVPQSRPRLFIVGAAKDSIIPSELIASEPTEAWHTKSVVNAHSGISNNAKKNWVWWDMPQPASPPAMLSDIIEEEPAGVNWHTHKETSYLLNLMDIRNREKVREVQAIKKPTVGTIYRRTRPSADGQKKQRAEVRFDNVAGCLRTPAGGSSRQTILIVDGKTIKSRLLSPREAARLMGIPEGYNLPARYNDAYKLAGDGVAIPVVRHLASFILEPVLRANRVMLAAE